MVVAKMAEGSRDYRCLQAQQLATHANKFLAGHTLVLGGYSGNYGGTVSHSKRFWLGVDAARDTGEPRLHPLRWSGPMDAGLEGGGSRKECLVDVPLTIWSNLDEIANVVREVMTQNGLVSDQRPEYYEKFWSTALAEQFRQHLNNGMDLSLKEDPLYNVLFTLQITSAVQPGNVLLYAARMNAQVGKLLTERSCAVGSFYRYRDMYGFVDTVFKRKKIDVARFDPICNQSTMRGPFYKSGNAYYILKLALSDLLDPGLLAQTISNLLPQIMEEESNDWQTNKLPVFRQKLSEYNPYEDK